MNVPLSGLTYTTELEWRLAAHWAGFRRYRSFAALPVDEQNEIVATYRAALRIQAVTEHEAMREARDKTGV